VKHEEEAERLEKEAERLDQHSEEVGSHIEEARQDWEEKEGSQEAPGAQPPLDDPQEEDDET
jgi:hypothetical protein